MSLEMTLAEGDFLKCLNDNPPGGSALTQGSHDLDERLSALDRVQNRRDLVGVELVMGSGRPNQLSASANKIWWPEWRARQDSNLPPLAPEARRTAISGRRAARTSLKKEPPASRRGLLLMQQVQLTG